MSENLGVVSACAFACLATLSACKDPTSAPPTGAIKVGAVLSALHEDCPAGDEWLPPDGGDTPPVRMFAPPPHPDTECPFYRGAYQNFLIATAPLENGDPAIVQYPTLDDAFISAKPHGVRNTAARSWLGAVRQAGQRDILIDRDN